MGKTGKKTKGLLALAILSSMLMLLVPAISACTKAEAANTSADVAQATEAETAAEATDAPAGFVDKTGEPISLRTSSWTFESEGGSKYLERRNGVLDTVGEQYQAAAIEANPTWFAKMESLLGISEEEMRKTAEMEEAEEFTPRAIFINGGMDISDDEARAKVAERWGYPVEELKDAPIVRNKGVINTYLAKDGNVYTFIDEGQWAELALGYYDFDTDQIKFGVKIDCSNILSPLSDKDYEQGLPRVDKQNPKEKPVTEAPKTEAPKTEKPVTEAPKTEAPKTETPKPTPSTEGGKGPSGTEPSKTEPPKTEPPKTEPPKTEPPKTEPPKTEPPKTEPPKTEPPKTEPPKTEPPRPKGDQKTDQPVEPGNPPAKVDPDRGEETLPPRTDNHQSTTERKNYAPVETEKPRTEAPRPAQTEPVYSPPKTEAIHVPKPGGGEETIPNDTPNDGEINNPF